MFILLTLITAAYLAPMLGVPVMGCLTAGTVVLVTDLSLRAGSRSFVSFMLLTVVMTLLMVALSPPVAELLPRNGTTRDVTVWLNS